jgi:hypothetical protein
MTSPTHFRSLIRSLVTPKEYKEITADVARNKSYGKTAQYKEVERMFPRRNSPYWETDSEWMIAFFLKGNTRKISLLSLIEKNPTRFGEDIRFFFRTVENDDDFFRYFGKEDGDKIRQKLHLANQSMLKEKEHLHFLDIIEASWNQLPLLGEEKVWVDQWKKASGNKKFVLLKIVASRPTEFEPNVWAEIGTSATCFEENAQIYHYAKKIQKENQYHLAFLSSIGKAWRFLHEENPQYVYGIDALPNAIGETNLTCANFLLLPLLRYINKFSGNYGYLGYQNALYATIWIGKNNPSLVYPLGKMMVNDPMVKYSDQSGFLPWAISRLCGGEEHVGANLKRLLLEGTPEKQQLVSKMVPILWHSEDYDAKNRPNNYRYTKKVLQESLYSLFPDLVKYAADENHNVSMNALAPLVGAPVMQWVMSFPIIKERARRAKTTEQRQQVVFLLLLSQGALPQSLSLIRLYLRDNDTTVRHTAIVALGHLYQEFPDLVIDKLCADLRHSSIIIRRNTVQEINEALGVWGFAGDRIETRRDSHLLASGGQQYSFINGFIERPHGNPSDYNYKRAIYKGYKTQKL